MERKRGTDVDVGGAGGSVMRAPGFRCLVKAKKGGMAEPWCAFHANVVDAACECFWCCCFGFWGVVEVACMCVSFANPKLVLVDRSLLHDVTGNSPGWSVVVLFRACENLK